MKEIHNTLNEPLVQVYQNKRPKYSAVCLQGSIASCNILAPKTQGTVR
uniref:Uncharacterized protein n=1 Tax=Arundo donax TaxID=35708 RepID=A0A0A9HKB9_ARUDO